MALSWAETLEALNLQGRVATRDEVESVQGQVGQLLSSWLSELITTYPIIEHEVELEPWEDESGIGVSFRWMTPSQMVSEAIEAQPGIAARRHDLIPIGLCLEGSGDPYFVHSRGTDDPAVLRVPHDAVHGGELDTAAIDTVAGSLSSFLRRGQESSRS